MWVITLSNLDLCYASDIEQGGYNETPTNTTRTITYPVAFSSIIGAWIAEIASYSDSDWGELTSKPNNTQLVYYQNGRSTGAYWYAIGV